MEELQLHHFQTGNVQLPPSCQSEGGKIPVLDKVGLTFPYSTWLGKMPKHLLNTPRSSLHPSQSPWSLCTAQHSQAAPLPHLAANGAWNYPPEQLQVNTGCFLVQLYHLADSQGFTTQLMGDTTRCLTPSSVLPPSDGPFFLSSLGPCDPS